MSDCSTRRRSLLFLSPPTGPMVTQMDPELTKYFFFQMDLKQYPKGHCSREMELKFQVEDDPTLHPLPLHISVDRANTRGTMQGLLLSPEIVGADGAQKQNPGGREFVISTGGQGATRPNFSQLDQFLGPYLCPTQEIDVPGLPWWRSG